MSEGTKPYQRAMADIDAVAKAICTAEGDNPSEFHRYRAVAVAAINSLGLTEELNTYEETDVEAVMGGEGEMRYGGQTITSLGWRTDRRLISPWQKIARSA